MNLMDLAQRIAEQEVSRIGERVMAAENNELLKVLRRYVSAYPAFRMKPVGAPGSPARIEQENLMALEEAALAAIAKAESKD